MHDYEMYFRYLNHKKLKHFQAIKIFLKTKI